MNTIYENKVNQMMAYYEILKNEFKWENDLSKHLVALSYVLHNKSLDTACIRHLKSDIKKKTGTFSCFRSNMMFSLCGLMCASSKHPEKILDLMIKNEKIFKTAGFTSTTYLPTALFTFSTVYSGGDVSLFADKAQVIYKEMKSNHPFLTGGDDYALSILLANTNHRTEQLENYYQKLDEIGFSKGNGLQMLSHILSFNDSDVQMVVERSRNIFEALKENKLTVTQQYYAALGLICLLEDDSQTLTRALIEVSTYLHNQKKYKWLSKGMNVLMASAIIASDYIKTDENGVVGTTLSVSIQNIIAAQQAAIIAAITASSASAASV